MVCCACRWHGLRSCGHSDFSLACYGDRGGSWIEAAHGVLRTARAAAGVWLVRNMGEEAVVTPGGVVEFARLAAWCLPSFALTRQPVIGGIVYAVQHRRYRPSMFPSTAPSAARKVGRHLLFCAVYTALLTVATHSEVRSAYKRLALKYRSDKVGSGATVRDLVETNRRFVEVQEAYDLLNGIEHARKKKAEANAGQQGAGRSGRQRHGDRRSRRDEM